MSALSRTRIGLLLLLGVVPCTLAVGAPVDVTPPGMSYVSNVTVVGEHVFFVAYGVEAIETYAAQTRAVRPMADGCVTARALRRRSKRRLGRSLTPGRFQPSSRGAATSAGVYRSSKA